MPVSAIGQTVSSVRPRSEGIRISDECISSSPALQAFDTLYIKGMQAAMTQLHTEPPE